MEIIELAKKPEIEQDKKLTKRYNYFKNLISELKKKEIPSRIATEINRDIEEINSFSGSNKELSKQIRKAQSNIFKLVEKELKIVPKNLNRNRWMAIGMTVFGIPLGMAFGASLGNMAYLGIGIPIGMAIGIAYGSGLDKKAFEEGRQLDLEIRD